MPTSGSGRAVFVIKYVITLDDQAILGPVLVAVALDQRGQRAVRVAGHVPLVFICRVARSWLAVLLGVLDGIFLHSRLINCIGRESHPFGLSNA
ncbi:hypothetical protein D3C72_1916520 [compost metagenome]